MEKSRSTYTTAALARVRQPPDGLAPPEDVHDDDERTSVAMAAVAMLTLPLTRQSPQGTRRSDGAQGESVRH